MSKIDIVYASHMWINGKTIKEIGERFGLKRTSVSDFIRRHKDRFPERKPIVTVVGALNPDEVAIAAKMWADGRSQGEIGERFNLSRSTIAGIMNRKRDIFPERYGSLMKLHKSAKSLEDIPVEHRTNLSANKLRQAFSEALGNNTPKPKNSSAEYDKSRLPFALTLMDLDTKTQCSWCVTDSPKGIPNLMCAEVKTSKRYCANHEQRAWRVK
jgi:DNA-binding CsgD family transcriptional regulator